MKKANFLILSSVAAATFAGAASVAPMFGSNAVIQRDIPAPVWGTGEPGSTVEISIFPARDENSLAQAEQLAKTVVNANGKWDARLHPFPATRADDVPNVLMFKFTAADGAATETIVSTNVLFGDVWICSGQSNMDMSYGWGLTRGKEDIETTSDPRMRLLDDVNAVAIKPLPDFTGPISWKSSAFADSRTFSACGWFFGQALRAAMPDVPIGLVEASWSGSPIKTWISGESYCAISPALAEEYAQSRAGLDKFEADGGVEEYQRRLALWNSECATKGDIHAEGIDFDDSGWAEVALPVKYESQFNDPNYDGCVWYRREIELTDGQAAGDATLNLGEIDDWDVAWVNGQPVGSNTLYNAKRSYKVPAAVLREGRNVIAVKTTDTGGTGGFTSPADLLSFATAAGSIPLSGTWRTQGFRFDPKPQNYGVNSWTPAACYNAMIHPLFPMAVKGAIWYQGCSDIGRGGDLYEKQFAALAADWRKGFTHHGQLPREMPIYIVQLASFLQTHDAPINSPWAEMRWSQMKLGETLDACGTAVAIDIGHHTDIHPKDKKTVGERLARLALKRTYGMADIVEAGPVPQRAVAGEGRITASFKNAAGLKTSDGGEVKGFQLVDAAGKAVWAKATIEGETVSVAVPDGFKAAKVRYAWDDYPVCNLVNGEDLPCGPFELPVAE